MKQIFTLISVYLFILSSARQLSAQGLTIQEAETGFCSVDGIIDKGVAGYTGSGFANTSSGIGVSITWSVFAHKPMKCRLYFRYANGGTVIPLKGSLFINDVLAKDTISFKHTGTWTNWKMSDTLGIDLPAGQNILRLKGHITNGLPNLDYLFIMDGGVEVIPYTCLPTYKLTVGKNIAQGGTVSYSPIKDYYEKGTQITLTATANPGYFFHSWNGEASGSTATYTFGINANSDIKAMFYPNGTKMDDQAMGYATVLDDKGTPFMMIGGALGDTVEANTIEDLIKYLGDTLHHTVKLNKHFTGTETTVINIKSNKTLWGTSPSAHIEGMRVTVSDAQNVILKNVTFSKVVRYDAVQLSNAKNIWIDHCDFYGDRIQPLDYYDGLLDIKNAAKHITISWSRFHDHLKAILISSGDAQLLDTVARLTFHHNYFYNCDARLPSLRFGKAHVFSNYFKNNGSAVNSRMDACIKIENNYFTKNDKAVRVDQSTQQGRVELVNNIFDESDYVSSPACVLTVPYQYGSFLDAPAILPAKIAGDFPAGLNDGELFYNEALTAYPNPAKESITIVFALNTSDKISFSVADVAGHTVKSIAEITYNQGRNECKLDLKGLKPGLYIYRMKSSSGTVSRVLTVE